MSNSHYGAAAASDGDLKVPTKLSAFHISDILGRGQRSTRDCRTVMLCNRAFESFWGYADIICCENTVATRMCSNPGWQLLLTSPTPYLVSWTSNTFFDPPTRNKVCENNPYPSLVPRPPGTRFTPTITQFVLALISWSFWSFNLVLLVRRASSILQRTANLQLVGRTHAVHTRIADISQEVQSCKLYKLSEVAAGRFHMQT